MDQGTQDQLAAAVRQARRIANRPVGRHPDAPPNASGDAPFLSDMLDTLCTPDFGRCTHLEARPIQPALALLPHRGWRCWDCYRTFALRIAGRWLGDIEEHTCDRCRRYVPSEKLLPLIARSALFIVVASLCTRCRALAVGDGAELLDPGHRAA